MFRRLSAWHIVTAGLIGLSPACGSGAREDATSQGKTATAQAMPSVAKAEPELTSVKPAATSTPAPAPVEPEAAPAEKSPDELLDQLTFDAEREPDDVRLRVKLARALFDAGKMSEARKQAERAALVDEESAAAWHMLGRVAMAERNFDAASASFQRAVEEDPENSYAWNNLGFTLIELTRYEEAAAALENATSGSSPTAYMWNNLGMAYEHMDRIREARAAYRQAAASGSSKGQVNLERLEGVSSLRPSTPIEVDQPLGASSEPVDQGSVGGAGQEPQEEEPGC